MRSENGLRVQLDPTIGELARRLDHVDAALDHIHTEMVPIQVHEAHREAHTAEIKRVHHRLDEIVAESMWTRRLLIGLFFTVLGGIATQVIVARIFG